MEDLTKPLVISYENDFMNNENSKTFEKTLIKNDWEYKIIGEGDKWEGFQTKINSYYKYLQQLDINKIIILSDARDVFCVRSPLCFTNSINKLTNIDEKIIVSAEIFLCGHTDWDEEKIAKYLLLNPNYFWQGIMMDNYWKTKLANISELPLRKYLNSGLIVGKVKNLIKAFEWIIINKYTDDQHGFSNYANKFPECIKLDINAEILHTSTFGVNGGLYDEKQKYDSPSFSELLGMSSYFLHIPGITNSKGQRYIYNIIKKVLDENFVEKNVLAKLYEIKLNSNLNYDYFIKN